MIKPRYFDFNSETAGSNVFQVPRRGLSAKAVQFRASKEFSNFVFRLKRAGINPLVFDDRKPVTPDAVFPNNWISFHEDGTVVLYPMRAPNRRLERRMDIVERLKKRFKVKRILDLSSYEKKGKFLEGTGSLVLDRVNKIAYACLSPRTDSSMLDIFSREMGYRIVKFKSFGKDGTPVYHTNVVMSVCDGFAVVCADSIKNKKERLEVLSTLKKTGHDIVRISVAQMHEFAGNVIQVIGKKGGKILLMSRRAYRSLNESQKRRIEEYSAFLVSPLDTIEKYGGGGAQCMMAEVFLARV